MAKGKERRRERWGGVAGAKGQKRVWERKREAAAVNKKRVFRSTLRAASLSSITLLPFCPSEI